jgi:tetratricopeptide (TPR) repeat protein
MQQGNRKWIIRDASGRIEGPFTTEKVLYKIGRGEFSGEEAIARYPDGRWIPISQDPQFYDKLLEVLANNQNEDPAESTRVLEFTRQESVRSEPEPEVEKPEDTRPAIPTTPPEAEPVELAPARSRKRRSKKRSRRPEDIELVDTRPQLWREILKRARVPLILVVGGLAVALIVFFESGDRQERIHLLAPQKGVPQVNAETLKGRIRQGVGLFLKDTFAGYTGAQNDFVQVVEKNGKEAEVMALLCMTYLQLWPYAYQDSSDMRAIGTVVQMAAAVDPGGVHSATCRVVDLVARARFQEAVGLVDSVLDSRANDANPPIMFYFLKGLLYEGGNEHASAVGYLRSAQQLWPQWILPYVSEAQAQTKLEHYSDAANIYRRVLNSNPEHAVARIELGILEYKYFSHPGPAESLLQQGLEGGAAPSQILSRGYFGLAEIALQKGDSDRALKFAQQAFSLNSSNAAAKNLIVQLGGVEKLKGTKVKGQQLLFEGDQFFREGDCHAAQAHYKAAFEEDPKNARAAIKAAQCLWKMSFSTEAIEWLNRAIKADPGNMEAYATLAEYQASRYNFQAAAQVLNVGRRVNPKSHEILRGFAIVELKRGDAAGAVNYGKQALQLYENDVETQLLLAQASLALKDYKMAYNYAAKAIEIDVNHRKAQIVFAQALAGLQGVDVGVDYLVKLVSNYSQVSEYRLALGRMLLADERFQQAEEIFRQIIKLDEKPKEAYVELARALRAEGSMNEALDLLLKAAVLDPADAEPLYLAGSIYLDIKRPQEATVQFQRVLTINKLYPLVHYQLGRAAMLMNEPREALNQTDEEKRANPNLADAYLLAAEAHTQLQQYANCATEYQKAIKLRPQQASIYVKVAQCYRKKGDLDAATAMLNVASTKESGLAEIYKEQGAIFEVRGDAARAIDAYRQYFVLDPDAPDREQIEGRISTLQRGQRP